MFREDVWAGNLEVMKYLPRLMFHTLSMKNFFSIKKLNWSVYKEMAKDDIDMLPSFSFV